jgi:hypothetical protein
MVLSQGSLSGHVRPTGWCARGAPRRDRQINAKAQERPVESKGQTAKRSATGAIIN